LEEVHKLKTARDEVSAAHAELEALLAEKMDENGTLSGQVRALETLVAGLETRVGQAEARGRQLRELLGVSGLRCLVSHARRPLHLAGTGDRAENVLVEAVGCGCVGGCASVAYELEQSMAPGEPRGGGWRGKVEGEGYLLIK
jgi:hypothetical protein